MKLQPTKALVAVVATAAALAAPAKTAYLDEFPLDSMSCGLRLRPRANRFPYTRDVRLDFASVDLPRKAWVKDLWRRKCLGLNEDGVTFSIPGHACMMLKVVEDCTSCESRK